MEMILDKDIAQEKIFLEKPETPPAKGKKYGRGHGYYWREVDDKPKKKAKLGWGPKIALAYAVNLLVNLGLAADNLYSIESIEYEMRPLAQARAGLEEIRRYNHHMNENGQAHIVKLEASVEKLEEQYASQRKQIEEEERKGARHMIDGFFTYPGRRLLEKIFVE
jgi:hypothetical protein